MIGVLLAAAPDGSNRPGLAGAIDLRTMADSAASGTAEEHARQTKDAYSTNSAVRTWPDPVSP